MVSSAYIYKILFLILIYLSQMPNTSIFFFPENMGSCMQVVFLFMNPILNILGNLPWISGYVSHYSLIAVFLLIWSNFLKVGSISVVTLMWLLWVLILSICDPPEEGCRLLILPGYGHDPPEKLMRRHRCLFLGLRKYNVCVPYTRTSELPKLPKHWQLWSLNVHHEIAMNLD